MQTERSGSSPFSSPYRKAGLRPRADILPVRSRESEFNKRFITRLKNTTGICRCAVLFFIKLIKLKSLRTAFSRVAKEVSNHRRLHYVFSRAGEGFSRSGQGLKGGGGVGPWSPGALEPWSPGALEP